MINHLLFFNLLVPLIVGLFFLLYFVYFVLANPSNTASYRYFVIFLIGFGLFIMGRSLQVMVGPHPWPLIIVNVRVFILCSVVAPFAMLTANVFKRKKIRHRELIIIILCIVLGFVYVVFNTLGTIGSTVIYEGNGLMIYDNLTPSKLPPFFSREVTLAVQVAIGLMLLTFSLGKLIRLKLGTSLREFAADKNFFINFGILIFALSFIVGSLAKQWWVYYAASVVSALFVGASVLMDIKDVHANYERLMPLIKEDILHNFALTGSSRIKPGEMLRMLGKKSSMDTFVVMRIKYDGDDLADDLAKLEAALGILGRHLGFLFDENDFILLPISNDLIGIVLSLQKDQSGRKFKLLETLEDAQAEIAVRIKCAVKIGIGRSYANIDDLRLSYFEALNAQEFAEQNAGSDVIHAENMIGTVSRGFSYPVREKERLLSAVKTGDVEESRRLLREFLDKFRMFIDENPGILKVRLYELAGSLIDSAIMGGGDEKKLNDLVVKYFNDINLIKDVNVAQKWLAEVVGEIAGNIGFVFDSRSKSLVQSAKKYIDQNYGSPLGYKDVAREIIISPSYFLNLFKKETGKTFTDYLTDVRITAAKNLLATSEMNITEISYAVGFNNSNYFSALFTKIAGIPAKEYRKRART